MSVASSAARLGQDPAFPLLKEHIITSTGLAYFEDKDADLAERIAARVTHLSMNDCGEYLALLKDHDAGEAERHSLVSLLTIGETYFFRHTEQFDALRAVVLPDLIERNRAARSLRIWSAGCAIGAEPYSLAILLKEHFAAQIAGWNVQILGTDINRAFLARATRGEFDERALRSASDDFKREWFVPSGRVWSVVPSVREWVSFQYHNLVEHPYRSIAHGLAAFDLILCRNVMIYFDWARIKEVLGHFHECLADDGWLAVGHAESNPELFQSYRTVNAPGATLYQKSREAAATWRPLATTPSLDQPQETSPAAWLPPLPLIAPTAPAPLEIPAAPQPSGLALVRRLADEGNWRDALTECEAVLRDDQLNASAHFYQGLILDQTAREEEAERAFRRSLYLDRAGILAHYHLAMLLKKRGDRDGAKQSLRNAQRLLAVRHAVDAIPDSDGLTADDLNRLTHLQLEMLT